MALTPESFERLLNWLHPDREEAGREFVRIRALLIRKFEAHDCCSADRLADATIDRVADTLTPEMIENWVGKKEKKFFRVAYYILLEDKNRLEVELSDDFNVPSPDPSDDELLELKSGCLEKCLQTLPPDKRELITRYYQGTRAEKIRNREDLARERGLELSALRVKALRIRKELKCCIQKCLGMPGGPANRRRAGK